MINKILNFILGKFKKPVVEPLKTYEQILDEDLISLLEIREHVINLSSKETPKMSTKPKKPKLKKEIKLTPEEETKIVSNIKKRGLYSEPTKKKTKK